jgi:hypothetical protein
MCAAITGYPKRPSTNKRRSQRHGGFRCPQAEALEDENGELKKLLAEAMLDNAILKDVASKKW